MRNITIVIFLPNLLYPISDIEMFNVHMIIEYLIKKINKA